MKNGQVFIDHKNRRIFRSYDDAGKIQEILAAPIGTTFLMGPKEYVRMLEKLVQELYQENYGGEPLLENREGNLHMLNALRVRGKE